MGKRSKLWSTQVKQAEAGKQYPHNIHLADTSPMPGQAATCSHRPGPTFGLCCLSLSAPHSQTFIRRTRRAPQLSQGVRKIWTDVVPQLQCKPMLAIDAHVSLRLATGSQNNGQIFARLGWAVMRMGILGPGCRPPTLVRPSRDDLLDESQISKTGKWSGSWSGKRRRWGISNRRLPTTAAAMIKTTWRACSAGAVFPAPMISFDRVERVHNGFGRAVCSEGADSGGAVPLYVLAPLSLNTSAGQDLANFDRSWLAWGKCRPKLDKLDNTGQSWAKPCSIRLKSTNLQ